jgi:hypothetical protein
MDYDLLSAAVAKESAVLRHGGGAPAKPPSPLNPLRQVS